jgi:hypothetical protein
MEKNTTNFLSRKFPLKEEITIPIEKQFSLHFIDLQYSVIEALKQYFELFTGKNFTIQEDKQVNKNKIIVNFVTLNGDENEKNEEKKKNDDVDVDGKKKIENEKKKKLISFAFNEVPELIKKIKKNLFEEEKKIDDGEKDEKKKIDEVEKVENKKIDDDGEKKKIDGDGEKKFEPKFFFNVKNFLNISENDNIDCFVSPANSNGLMDGLKNFFFFFFFPN